MALREMDLLIYKLLTLLSGMGCIWMGYRLLLGGVFRGDKGEIEATFGNHKLLIRRASPGVVFALFGALIVGGTIAKGYKGETKITETTLQPGELTDSYLDSIGEGQLASLETRIAAASMRKKNSTGPSDPASAPPPEHKVIVYKRREEGTPQPTPVVHVIEYEDARAGNPAR